MIWKHLQQSPEASNRNPNSSLCGGGLYLKVCFVGTVQTKDKTCLK